MPDVQEMLENDRHCLLDNAKNCKQIIEHGRKFLKILKNSRHA